jgi:hypothetical protein
MPITYSFKVLSDKALELTIHDIGSPGERRKIAAITFCGERYELIVDTRFSSTSVAAVWWSMKLKNCIILLHPGTSWIEYDNPQVFKAAIALLNNGLSHCKEYPDSF